MGMRLYSCLLVASAVATVVTAAAAPNRASILKLIADNPNGHLDPKTRTKVSNALTEYAASQEDSTDVLLAIGASVYGWKRPKTVVVSDTPLVIVDFDYMKQFIHDVFVSYDVTPERAAICADVLIESDKRGIDSHGLGRLKPIYCDRMDQGILWPERPIEVVKETETTALVDGNLGLGLYIGPYW